MLMCRPDQFNLYMHVIPINERSGKKGSQLSFYLAEKNLTNGVPHAHICIHVILYKSDAKDGE